MTPFRIAIIGTGWIAEKMAITVAGMQDVEIYAVVSRTMERAQSFAGQWNIKQSFDSIGKMLDDENVDLVYIATPHSNHYEEARICLLKEKPVLCEKAFTATAWQTEELLQIAKERNVFITEAIWTRYMPLSKTINEIIESGVIGKPVYLSANLGYPNYRMERMTNPDLAGGALLDLGVYPINFASMILGADIEHITSTCTLMNTGVDGQNSITITYAGGGMAVLSSTLYAKTDRQGLVAGENGYIIVENINNPQKVMVVGSDYQILSQYDCPPQITGYEYQVYASIEAIRNGWIESPFMPHTETLRIMKLMDGLRKSWGVKYPSDRD
ncbi:putative dehydrogenase [Dysgonomonas sp. PFB1-18]|uniref:Gfo/Idh/MocA family protein n=1 Tax=unclassified Dysgonomonas TaxID=2630389 RepID=UPI00247537F8|nr:MULTISPECIES: Gfo/Idh/MocA family oxidoreductase [unclassified Dysgonomonas]MDH6310129.1 putative dehydrogenase [Dysgonomonas sp. PF1-14]MDH6340205.1 putative dehydrogenase [Dysgonomonas sp. PF1-16]MDH6381686.1 putative dehydrogenase [Dysgonomonas sp. PFB1-18]MDH6399045.1 putative dehydrogenase [Dysgonomonas sp. PF1-23]